ncbi:MAG: RecX family transcriptional regulator [Bacteroidia bacterium]
MEEKKKIKITDVTIGLQKAEKYCAYQERCQQELRNKLYEWGLYSSDVEKIISQLISDNFLNEERFAKAFAGGKFRIKKWGKIKIENELKKKKISAYSIKKALQILDDNDSRKNLKKLLEKKYPDLSKEKSKTDKYKAARYFIGKGYESEMVWKMLNMDSEN